MNRQRLILAALLALFSASLIYSYWRMPRQKTVDKLKYQPGMTATRPDSKPGKVNDTERVRLDLLDRAPGFASTGGKNIFLNLFPDELKKVPVPLPPPPPPPEKKPAPPPSVPVQAPAPAVVEQTPLQRDLANFTFLGFMKKDSRKTIFLTNGKEIFVVKKGDKISNKYDVTSVTDESLTITSLQDSGEIIIPLIENRPLNAPKR
jgi:hypothetical protein